MSLIEWRDEFSLGIASVDHEHRELIDLINETYANLSKQVPTMPVVDFLGEIHTKISAHFALEERIMREKNYDQYQEHKDDHEHLLDGIRDIMDDFESQQEFDQEAFAQRLAEWFTEHFRTKDARLHQRLH